jgi:hypothetical protein
MKCLVLASVLSMEAFAQTPVIPNLPSIVTGFGVSDNRGTSPQYGVDVTVAVRMQKTNLYWWNNISTPIGKAAGNKPLASTVETGAAWAAAQSGRVTLVFIMLGGLSIAPSGTSASSFVAPNISASMGLSISLSQHWAVMPYFKLLATSTGPTTAIGTAPIATIVQPGFEFHYLFN